MNKNEVGLWDDVMVELHKINIGRDARGVDMIHAGIDGAGVCAVAPVKWIAF